MARTNNLTNFLNDVATAIKAKLGDNTPILASQFDTKIGEIETVGTYQSKTLNISANGSQTITPDTGYDALSSVVINVQVPVKQLQSKTYEFTQNTHIVLSPETGYDGFSSIDLTIAVPSSGGNLQTKNVTYDRNGEYTLTPDNGYDGISRANVTVQTPYNAKIFETVQQMNADTDAKLNDMAMIYGLQANPVSPNVNVDKWYLPKTITLPREVTEDISFEFGYGGGGGCPTLSSTGFMLYGQMGMDMFHCKYESEDGVHYTRTMLNIESMGGSDSSILWDDELNILYNMSTYDEHFWYSIDNVQQAEDWLDVFQAIFREPQYTFNSLYRYMGTTNTSLITAAKNIVVHANGSEDISDWTLTADYLYNEKTYQEFLSVVNAVKSAISSSISYVILEYLSNNNYRVYVSKYIYTSSGSTNYTSPSFMSKLKLDNTDYNTYITFSYNSSYYSNCELLVYNVDMTDSSNPAVTNVTSQYTINTYNVGTSYALYTLPVSQNNYITSRGTYQNQDMKMNFVIPTSSSISGYGDLILDLKVGMDLSYLPAETQFTLDNDNQLLPGKIALGSNGSHTGDGSIYNNLDSNIILTSVLGLPLTNKLTFVDNASKYNIEYYKYNTSGNICKLSSNLKDIHDIESVCTDRYKTSYDGFAYLNIAKTYFCYENNDHNLVIKDLQNDTTTIKNVSRSSSSSYCSIVSSPNEIIYYIGSDLYVHIYDINLATDITTTISVTSGHYGLSHMRTDNTYGIIQVNYSGSATSKIYALNASNWSVISTLTGVGSYWWCDKTQLDNYYFLTQNPYRFYQFTGTAFVLKGSSSTYSGIETSSYLFGHFRGDYWNNQCCRSNKTGGYTMITMNVTSDCQLSAYWLKVTNDYVWTIGKLNNDYYVVKCSYTITNNTPVLTQIYKYKIPANMLWSLDNTKYTLDRVSPVYYEIIDCDDTGISVNYSRRTTNTYSSFNTYRLDRIVKSNYTDYDFAGIRDSDDKRYDYDTTSKLSQFNEITI